MEPKSHEKTISGEKYLENKPGFVQSVRSRGISLQQNITKTDILKNVQHLQINNILRKISYNN